MKKVAVLFSGGLDSTYLVWKNLKDGNEVYPIYVEIENNIVKTILEKNRTKLLCELFSEEFNENMNYGHIHNVHYAISVGVKAYENSLYFKQVPIWIFTLMFIQSIGIDEIQVGYVCGDDAIPYLNDIQKIYKSYQSICEPLKPLKFPIIKIKKEIIAHELPSQYLDLIISCENAKIIGNKDAEIVQYEPCGSCVPCETIISTNYYGLRNFPEIYKKPLIRLYSKKLHKFNHKVLNEDGFDVMNLMCEKEERFEPIQLEIDFHCIGGDYDYHKKNEDDGCGIISK